MKFSLSPTQTAAILQQSLIFTRKKYKITLTKPSRKERDLVPIDASKREILSAKTLCLDIRALTSQRNEQTAALIFYLFLAWETS